MQIKRKKPGMSDANKMAKLRTTLQSVSQDRRAKELQKSLGIVKVRIPGKDDNAGAAVTPENVSTRKLWNRAMPVLNCTNCAMTSQCPKYRAGYECAFLPFLNGHKIESPSDLIFYLKELVAQGVRRVQQAMMFETMTGAPPSLELSEQMSTLTAQGMALHSVLTDKNTIELETTDKSVITDLFGDGGSLLESTTAKLAQISELNDLVEIKDDTNSADSKVASNVNADLVNEMARTSKHSSV